MAKKQENFKQKTEKNWGWKDGSEVTITCCSFRELIWFSAPIMVAHKET